MCADKVDAGKQLANALKVFAGEDSLIVLAIPRGGVVVGYEVARVLKVPLDIIIPRKIGAPNQPELAIGAVGQDGSVVLNNRVVAHLGVSRIYIEEESRRQQVEIKRRLDKYRGELPFPRLKGRKVIVVDDGVATGATLKAALAFVRKQGVKELIVALPVGPLSSINELKKEVDQVICLLTPESFYAIGQFYKDFSQTSDEQVINLLDSNRKELNQL
jgi:predicted phosphoribosyltransferase